MREARDVLWVVSTDERGDLAENSFRDAGFSVRRVRTEAPEPPAEGLTRMQLYRQHIKRKESLQQNQYPQPEQATITVVAVHRIEHRKPLEAIADWASPVVVFDHLGVPVSRWLTAVSEGSEAGSMRMVPAERSEDAHPIPVFYDRGVPSIFIARDELEIALHAGYFRKRETEVLRLTSQYHVPERLKVTVVGTKLVRARHATAAFLAMYAAICDVQLVGESIIGAATPDRLSMATPVDLSRVVLRIGQPADWLASIEQQQTGMTRRQLRDLRARDFIRTVALSLDPRSRAPELVVLCPADISRAAFEHAQQLAGSVKSWSPTARELETAENDFACRVLRAAYGAQGVIAHRGRSSRIRAAFQKEGKRLPQKFGRLALALHADSAEPAEWDLAARPEDLMGRSERIDGIVALFNTLLDDAFPWNVADPQRKARTLADRQEAIAAYRGIRSWL